MLIATDAPRSRGPPCCSCAASCGSLLFALACRVGIVTLTAVAPVDAALSQTDMLPEGPPCPSNTIFSS